MGFTVEEMVSNTSSASFWDYLFLQTIRKHLHIYIYGKSEQKVSLLRCLPKFQSIGENKWGNTEHREQAPLWLKLQSFQICRLLSRFISNVLSQQDISKILDQLLKL